MQAARFDVSDENPIATSEIPALAGPPEYATFLHKLRAYWNRPWMLLRCLWGGRGCPTHFRGPVRWLLAQDLLAHLSAIALYSSHGEELDHRDWMNAEVIDLSDMIERDGTFWFDYMSDIGDGQLAMYDLAYLILGDVYLIEGDNGKRVVRANQEGNERLPRGRFLFLGGDTAYHVADAATIESRVRAPFAWALGARSKMNSQASRDRPRYVFAIPGNHDYYDSLTGYNRLFRAPGDPRTTLADYTRRQSASFAILKLPHDWTFVGLDSQNGKLDHRQREFAKKIASGAKRLIVATPEPATVYEHVDENAARPFDDLALPRPFARTSVGGGPSFPTADAIHLDLAGDIHHYARYQAEGAHNYAYVVSGGGAFLHPSHPSFRTESGNPPAENALAWPPKPAEQFPKPADSRANVTARLLCPWYVFQGGLVWLIGALSSAALYFGAVTSPHTKHIELRNIRWSRNTFIEKIVSVEGVVVVAFLVTLLAGLWAMRWFKSAMQANYRRVIPPQRYLLTAVSVIQPTIVMMSVAYIRHSQESHVGHSFASSVLLALFISGLPLSFLWSARYMATLPKQAKLRLITWRDSLPRWLVLFFGACSAAYGLAAYGMASAAHVAADLLVLTAFVMMVFGPPFFAVRQGAQHLQFRKKMFLLFFGIWLAFLQVTVPLELALHATGLLLVVACVLPLIFAGGMVYGKKFSRAALLPTWIVLGFAVVGVALMGGAPMRSPFVGYAIAFVAGAYFTSVWFGWYLATSLAFDGHFNEAGGAARLDRFRHFIRFKLETDKLTGYVIGFDHPNKDLDQLEAHIVDVITLRAQSPRASAEAGEHAPP